MYSLQNAQKFNWSSINGDLIPERVSHLKNYLIGEIILDIGCGGGAYTHFLSAQGLRVTGVDLHREFLQVASDFNRNGDFVEADILNLPFEDNYFDSSFCFDVLEHVDDLKALSEIARVTSKRIILSVPSRDDSLQKFGLMLTTYQDPTHLRYYSEDLLKELCLTINPSRISIFPEGYLPCRLISDFLIEDSLQNIHFGSKRPAELGLIKNRCQIFYNYLVRKLLKKAFYKKIYMGLVAIIDLTSDLK